MTKSADRYEVLERAYGALKQTHADLRRHYLLSGIHKKIDIPSLPGFAEIARQVREEGRAGMDYDRLYTLWQCVMRAPAGPAVVEIGAFKGGSARFIAESFRYRSLTPRFFVCDTFSGHARIDDTFDIEQHRSGRKFLDTSADSVIGYLSPHANVEVVVGDIIETAPRTLGNQGSFSLVHIDVDVYPPTEFCLRFFAPLLARGGLIIVDDYGFTTCPGAKKAVDDFIEKEAGFSMLHLLSGQAVLFRAG